MGLGYCHHLLNMQVFLNAVTFPYFLSMHAHTHTLIQCIAFQPLPYELSYVIWSLYLLCNEGEKLFSPLSS